MAEWIGTAEAAVLERFFQECEAELQAEATRLRAESDADPTSDSKKKASMGAKWTLFHMRTLKDMLRKRLPQ